MNEISHESETATQFSDSRLNPIPLQVRLLQKVAELVPHQSRLSEVASLVLLQVRFVKLDSSSSLFTVAG